MTGRTGLWRRLLRGPAHRRRVPVVLSDTQVECGAACLSMILGYYRRPAPLAETAERCDVGRDGASALMISRAARAYGMEVRSFAVHDLGKLDTITLPAVLHWEFNHFVVLERQRQGRSATVVDPAKGRGTLPWTELEQKFTGVVLTMSPTPGFDRGAGAKPSGNWELAGTVWKAKGVRSLFVQAFFASFFLLLMGLAGPAVTALIIDRFLPEGAGGALYLAAAAMALVLLARSALGYLRTLVLIELENHVEWGLMSRFFNRLVELPITFFQSRSSGDLLQRLDTNHELRTTLTTSLLGGAMDALLILVYGAILAVLSPLLGLATLLLGLLQFSIAASPNRLSSLVLAEVVEFGKVDGFAVEAIGGMNSVKASGYEPWAIAKWAALYRGQIDASTRRARFAAVLETVRETLSALSPMALLVVGAGQVLSGRLTVGAMLGLTAMADQVLDPLTRISVTVRELRNLRVRLNRVAAVMTAPAEQPDTVKSAWRAIGGRRRGSARIRMIEHALREAPNLTGQIELHDVGVQHPGSGTWAIRHIDLDIPAGSQVAFVGESGSGKSTLMKSMLGLYEPAEGHIFFDGISLRELRYGSVRRQCGVVTQEADVFQGTIRQNISLGRGRVSMSAIRRAARLADVERDIEEMPMGYDTYVGEAGAGLSGGQRQRIALARALVHQPALLFLDEATSALDPLTQARISRNLAEIDCTVVMVAHRLAAIRSSDLIVVLDGGQIVETGDHDSLVRAGGLYSEMLDLELFGDDSEDRERAAG